MRNLLTIIIIIATFTLSAQNYSPCYKEKYQQGVSLYNSGKYEEAKAKFVAAKSCPVPNTKEADTWIEKCNTKLNPAPPKIPTIVTTDANGNQIFTIKNVTFKMVRVQGGTFTMGCTSEQENRWNPCDDNEKPSHKVTLSTYYIGETEVTQELWKAVMDNNPSEFKGDKRPVEQVSWDDCQKFIRKLSQITGKNFRLPTEAEWEFAARGGTKSAGYKYSGSNDIDAVAWYRVNALDKGKSSPDYGTHVVKTKQPNELGLYDMAGNVYEWCSDWYGKYTDAAQSNPQSLTKGSYRVYRGGSWYGSAGYCRTSYRSYYSSDYRTDYLGVRLVLIP